jgi:rod shape determining protein RodA
MIRTTDRHFKFDWISIILFIALMLFGLFNIASASQGGEVLDWTNLDKPYTKQLLFIVLSVILIIILLSLESKFYERFSSIIYVASMLSLVGLFIFGKNVNGATSWYGIGGMTLQPSEFAKAATALAIAKYISDLNTDIKQLKHQFNLLLLLCIPALLIVLQKDAGSALVYGAFAFVLYREGLPQNYLHSVFLLIIVAIVTLKFGIMVAGLVAISIISTKLLVFSKKKKRKQISKILGLSILYIGIAFAINYTFTELLPPHQKDRITIWLSLEKDPEKLERMKKLEAYNLNESEKAISSGGFSGKGFLQGTRTTGNFVPEQHTDYIFSTVGEEWGFLGSIAVVIVFVMLMLRILFLAEKQKNIFSRIYGYSVASILFFHFLINIGMVMGLIPTIGIPLPLFSYGGSGLWGFTILVFIFIKLDSNRINEW